MHVEACYCLTGEPGEDVLGTCVPVRPFVIVISFHFISYGPRAERAVLDLTRSRCQNVRVAD